ncbi:MAG: hypothetical protein R3F62_08505 [Planctomycetota bacterium]
MRRLAASRVGHGGPRLTPRQGRRSLRDPCRGSALPRRRGRAGRSPRARGWSLLEALIACALLGGFLIFAGGVSLRLHRHYQALAVHADDLARATRQLDQVVHDVRRARRVVDQTPDGALKTWPLCVVLERPDGAVVSYRMWTEPRPGEPPRLERRVYAGEGPPLIEDLGRIQTAVFEVTADAGGTLVRVSLGLPERGGASHPRLESAARCQAGAL